jgi:hypothetical protein
MADATNTLSYDQRLARIILDGDTDADQAAQTLFERHSPNTLTQAVDLVVPYDPVPPKTFARISHAYDIYRHARNMPSD